MSEPTVASEPAQPGARRRKLLRVAAVLGLVVAVGVLALFVLRKKAPGPGEPGPEYLDEKLKAAVAEADRLDPHWRFADLEAERAPVPADENAAPLVLASVTLLPDWWQAPDLGALRERLRKGTPDGPPRADLEPAAAMLFEARKLAGYRRGRYAVDWNLQDPLVTPLPHLRAANAAVELLAVDAEVRAHEGDVGGALVSVRAALVAARTIGDEPLLESQLRRPGWHAVSVQALEESLRRGQGTEGELLAVQGALEAEAAEPLMWTAARAERAGWHGLMTALEKGDLTLAQLAPAGRGGQGTEAVRLILSDPLLGDWRALHAWLLDYATKFVEIARLPSPEWAPRLKELADTAAQAPPGATRLLTRVPVRDIGEVCQKGRALLRCAAAGLALERYRLAKGGWPDKLAELAPKYLATVPADPFDGRPLRYARHKEGVVVYSAGPDGKGGDGPGDPNWFEKKDGSALSFRLWNAEARPKKK